LFLDDHETRLVGGFQGAYLTDGALATVLYPGCARARSEGYRPLADLLLDIADALPAEQADRADIDAITPYDGDFLLPLASPRYALCGYDWAYKANPMGESYVVNGNCTDGAAGSSAQQVAEINKAPSAWNNAGADFSFNYGGTSGGTSVTYNGTNLVFFSNNPPGGGNYVAATYIWQSGGDITECDLVFNDRDYSWWNGQGGCSGQFDIWNVATHEFGHFLCLADLYGGGDSAKTMYGYVSYCDTHARTLHSDDINGIISIYGTGGPSCGDGSCSGGEDQCSCPADCGNPPGSENNCTDGVDNDCDNKVDCADADCNGDPACGGGPGGEGFILSRNSDFSTDDRTFYDNEIIYMMVWSDRVNYNDIKKSEWELRDPNKNKVRQALTNHFDGTYTASFDLAGLPSNATDWTWKGKVEDNSRTKYNPSANITVLAGGGGAYCGDGNCDPGEDQCSCSADCGNPPGSENNCTDGIDNDCDNQIDCADADCNGDPACGGGAYCGDGNCDPGEDQCSCSADCGNPPGSENNCTDGVDNDCDNQIDCADADCNGDPACGGGPGGEGFILSRNPDFSTDDRNFSRSEIIYMMVWSDRVNYNDIKKSEWELRDPNKNKVKQALTNHFDGTYTASFDLAGLPSNATSWTWKGKVEDNNRTKYNPTANITVSP
jgi:hypothetical protein